MTKKNRWFYVEESAHDSSSNQKGNLTWVNEVAGSRQQEKMTSTDLRRTINAPTWTVFHLFLQKELTTNVYKTKRSSTELFISSVIPRDMYASVRAKKTGKWGDARAQQPITFSNERTGFLPARYGNNATNFIKSKKNRAIFVWMKKKKDFIKVRRKQSYNKHLIRRLTSQYGWVFLLVELYFDSPKGSPKYC